MKGTDEVWASHDDGTVNKTQVFKAGHHTHFFATESEACRRAVETLRRLAVKKEAEADELRARRAEMQQRAEAAEKEGR